MGESQFNISSPYVFAADAVPVKVVLSEKKSILYSITYFYYLALLQVPQGSFINYVYTNGGQEGLKSVSVILE